MKDISINEFTFNVPTNYNELTVKQLRAVSRLMVKNTAENQLRCIYKLLGLRAQWSHRQRWWELKTLPAVWLHTLIADRTLFGWIFDSAKLTDYPIRKFKSRGIVYHGPPENILNLTVQEITLGYQFFRNYSKTNDVQCIDRLLALIYRPMNPFYFLGIFGPNYNSDKRLPLNNYFFNLRTERFKKLSIEIKTSVFLQFAGAWEEFQNLEQNRLLFPKVQDATSSQEEDPYMWQKIMMTVAEKNVFGNKQAIENMQKDDFFMYLVKNIEDYIKQKDAMRR